MFCCAQVLLPLLIANANPKDSEKAESYLFSFINLPKYNIKQEYQNSIGMVTHVNKLK